MIAIVCSRADEASEHVVEHVLENREFETFEDDSRPDADGGGTYYRSDAFEVRFFEDLHLYLDGVAEAFDDPEYLVFASRHSGETGPLLSAHVTGNFGAAEYGGKDGELAAAPPYALSAVVDGLAEHAPEEYDVGVECTHHGPSEVGVPSMFVELGSGPEEWADSEGARAVARAILDLAGGDGDVVDGGENDTVGSASGDGQASDDPDHVPAFAPRENGTRRHLVGFGGGHYAPRFTRIVRETDWAVGHVAADWCLDAMGDPDPDVLDAAFERSAAEYAVVDGDHPELEAAIADLGYRIVSETWVRETTGVPLTLVETAEELLRPIDEGLRFGEPARSWDGAVDENGRERGSPPSTVSLPNDLFDAVQGIDREATLAALDEHCLAYETEENGTRVGGRALVVGDRLPEGAIDRLPELLGQRYESVERDGDAVVVEERAFDPSLAAEAGVPEGPAFGKLADGQPVEVDGETIEPEAVTEHVVERFEIPE